MIDVTPQDPAPGLDDQHRAPADYAESIALPVEPDALPPAFRDLEQSRDWWLARPAGSRLVGLVVARDDMPSIVQQRDELSRFGVPIEGFRHPAPETMETWQERLTRLFGRLSRGDVVVVATVHALGRDVDEESRTIAELRRRGVIVKVLSHTGDTGPVPTRAS
ncbi:recombinase family protein [Microbacterium sp. zg.Y1090]|uniref:recombinase family protein n=1 Tax=Microbacterium TaxID=33882 RepID=UPI00214C73B0|nr:MULTISPECIES: recombinase family protein [unclassified Microbacterium]MCR2813155.1 recombinase family protein [Microbacterium sp. zg.Y1084]MCR2819468.1 recombinase family protein [Microbacterium sp. zg.Y1090]MDL5487322.1 recombinase family protein [Microbacterium sp. zg-Y1211]WIM28442.1 recombinase family protein [Microbacterium sp. zg-Y1090]